MISLKLVQSDWSQWNCFTDKDVYLFFKQQGALLALPVLLSLAEEEVSVVFCSRQGSN